MNIPGILAREIIMTTTYIGIGSNLGKRKDNCMTAINHLAESGITVSKHSSLMETEPWGGLDQPKFINMVVQADTDHDPVQLLILLKNIEQKMGRTPSVRWGPRAIDLDILLYGVTIVKTSDLEIPHPRLQERDFVLRPLAEIAPDLVHPVLKKSIRQILNQLDKH